MSSFAVFGPRNGWSAPAVGRSRSWCSFYPRTGLCANVETGYVPNPMHFESSLSAGLMPSSEFKMLRFCISYALRGLTFPISLRCSIRPWTGSDLVPVISLSHISLISVNDLSRSRLERNGQHDRRIWAKSMPARRQQKSLYASRGDVR